MKRILVVDDDAAERQRACAALAEAGFAAEAVTSGREALALLFAEHDFSAVLLDLVMPDLDGCAVLETLRRQSVLVPVLAVSDDPSPALARTVLALGASDLLARPLMPHRLVTALHAALRLRDLAQAAGRDALLPGPDGLDELVAGAPDMARAIAIARKIARHPLPVLIEGEAGTGKTALARALHAASDRGARALVVFDCTRAEDAQDGLFRPGGAFAEAQGGTLLLRNADALSPPTQQALREALESSKQAGPGGTRHSVRIVATSRRRLLALARAGAFRDDLYLRLGVCPITLPPLRQRRGDMEALAHRVLVRVGAERGCGPIALSNEALDLLTGYDWPGNLRQFEAMLSGAARLAEGDVLTSADLPRLVAHLQGLPAARAAFSARPLPPGPFSIDQGPAPSRPERAAQLPRDRFLDEQGALLPLAELERTLIVFAIKRCKGHMSLVARSLGIGRSTLYRKLAEYGLGGMDTAA